MASIPPLLGTSRGTERLASLREREGLVRGESPGRLSGTRQVALGALSARRREKHPPLLLTEGPPPGESLATRCTIELAARLRRWARPSGRQVVPWHPIGIVPPRTLWRKGTAVGSGRRQTLIGQHTLGRAESKRGTSAWTRPGAQLLWGGERLDSHASLLEYPFRGRGRESTNKLRRREGDGDKSCRGETPSTRPCRPCP